MNLTSGNKSRMSGSYCRCRDSLKTFSHSPPTQLGEALRVRERPWSSLGSTGKYVSSLKFERPSVVAHEHGQGRRDCLRQVLPLKESIRNLSWEF